MTAPRALREVLQRSEMLLAPGAYDGITARAVARAGFSAVYMTGAGTAASLGFPDYGLATMGEMVANAGRLAAAVPIPVIADADTGYGNELNVARTVREFEQAGVAAIHLEDQVFPKRCGHLDQKRVIPAEEFHSKIRAAAESRRDRDFLIIARTDARAVIGFDEAIARANGALKAGADVAFVEAPQTIEEVNEIPRRVDGPCLFNWVGGGKTPPIRLEAIERAGYRLTIAPVLLFMRTILACEDALDELRRTGAHPEPSRPMTLAEAFRRVGAEDWDEIRRRFGSS